MRVFAPLVLLAVLGAQAPSECLCPIVKIYGGWCDACNMGYIAGLKVPSKMLFEVLHNHGHDVNRRFMTCDSCRKEIDVDGFCEKCRIGYLEEQAYFSMLAYQLARGKAKRPEQITCETCKKNVEKPGWCEMCQVGMLGNVAIADRAGFQAALPEFRRLLLGLAHLPKCESCAVAIATNGMCPDCRISYQDGIGTQLPPPQSHRPDKHE